MSASVPSLRSRRLRLVALTPAHLAAAHGLWTEPEVREYLWDGETISQDRALEPLRTSEIDFRERGFGLWGLEAPPATELAGFCGLRQADLLPEPELLFGLRREYWSQGLGFEAAETVLEHGFVQLGLAVVGAVTDVPNERSIRLLERLGMVRVREAAVNGRPTVFYRLTAAQWQS